MKAIINLDSKTEDIYKLYSNGNNTFKTFPDLDSMLSIHDVMKIISKHKKQDYIDLLIEKVLFQTSSEEIINYLYEEFFDNESVINEIVMSGRATEEMLEELVISTKDKILAEYCEVGLFWIKLKKAKEISEYEIFLNEYASDKKRLNITARYHIAAYENTPKTILEILSNDIHKHIADEAILNLEKRFPVQNDNKNEFLNC